MTTKRIISLCLVVVMLVTSLGGLVLTLVLTRPHSKPPVVTEPPPIVTPPPVVPEEPKPYPDPKPDPKPDDPIDEDCDGYDCDCYYDNGYVNCGENYCDCYDCNGYYCECDYDPTHTVTFNLGDTTHVIQDVEHETTIMWQLPEPVRSGYRFLIWSGTQNGTAVFDFSAPIVADTTIFAVFERVFLTSGGQITGLSAFGNAQSHLTIPTVIGGQAITSLGANAFFNATRLTHLTFNGTIAQWDTFSASANLRAGIVINCNNGPTITTLPGIDVTWVNRNFAHNSARPPYPTDANGMIQRQGFLGAWLYGDAGTMAAAGCGVIAIYNAFVHLGYPMGLAELIRLVEATGGPALAGTPLDFLSGNFGTWPNHIQALRSHPLWPESLNISTPLTSESMMLSATNNMRRDAPGRPGEVLILSFHHLAYDLPLLGFFVNPLGGAHKIAVTRNADGTFSAHNNGHDGVAQHLGFDITMAYPNGAFWNTPLLGINLPLEIMGAGAFIVG